MKLRDLLDMVNTEASVIDEEDHGQKKSKSSLSNSSSDDFVQVDRANSSSTAKKITRRIGTLQHRDLRRLEYNFNPLGEPSVLLRRHCCVVSFDPIRVVVMANRILLLVPIDSPQSMMKMLEENINSGEFEASNVPFEERAYDAICATVVALLNEEYEAVKEQTFKILNLFRRTTLLPASTLDI